MGGSGSFFLSFLIVDNVVSSYGRSNKRRQCTRSVFGGEELRDENGLVHSVFATNMVVNNRGQTYKTTWKTSENTRDFVYFQNESAVEILRTSRVQGGCHKYSDNIITRDSTDGNIVRVYASTARSGDDTLELSRVL